MGRKGATSCYGSYILSTSQAPAPALPPLPVTTELSQGRSPGDTPSPRQEGLLLRGLQEPQALEGGQGLLTSTAALPTVVIAGGAFWGGCTGCAGGCAWVGGCTVGGPEGCWLPAAAGGWGRGGGGCWGGGGCGCGGGGGGCVTGGCCAFCWSASACRAEKGDGTPGASAAWWPLPRTPRPTPSSLWRFARHEEMRPGWEAGACRS